MFMSPSHAIINVSLREAFFPSHAFSLNIGNRQGRGVSRVQIWYKIVEYLSQDYHEINWKFTNREITCWGISCRNITRCKTTGHELGHVNRKWTFRIPEQCFCPKCSSNILYNCTDTWYKFGSVKAYWRKRSLTSGYLLRSKTSLLKIPNANVELMPVFTGIKENMIYLLF